MDSSTLKPIFCRIGNKFRIYDKIIPHFPDDSQYDTYIEPFVGSAAIFLNKNPSKKEILNDLDSELIDAYKLIKKIRIQDYNTENYDLDTLEKQQKFLFKNPINQLELLIQYIISFCNTFSNRPISGSKKIYKPSNPMLKIERIPSYKNRFKNTTFLNEDYKKVIDKYDNTRTLFYLDPPYENHSTTGKFYNHQSFDFEELRNILLSVKGFVALSLNDSPYIRKLFKDFRIIPIFVKSVGGHTIGGKGRKEVLILNY
jgi:DNA adenine methylase